MNEFMRTFLRSDKPVWVTAPDFAVMLALMTETTPEQPVTWVSIPTIAQRTGVRPTAVKEAIATLENEKWITRKSGKRQNNTNVYEVMFHNLPLEQKEKTTITDEARALAVVFRDIYLRYHLSYANKRGRRCRRKLRRDWRDRWSYVIQTFLDEGHSPDFITRVFNWASANRPKQFRAGPQGLKAIWPKEAQAQ